jgi:hypothetical protein
MVFWRIAVDMWLWQGAKWGWSVSTVSFQNQMPARVSGQGEMFSALCSNCPALMRDSLIACQSACLGLVFSTSATRSA